MLMQRIIPCLDVLGGRVVKGVRFGCLQDSGDPVELARRYEAEGADELVLLDISATREDRIATASVINRVRTQLRIPLTVGGGIKTLNDARTFLNAGADKVSMNSGAVGNPAIINEVAETFGKQCAVVAIDARRQGEDWDVLVASGSRSAERSAIAWAQEAEARGAGEILLTSWDRDGTGQGFDTELIAAVVKRISIPVIASGGAKTPQDFATALAAGAHAVLAAGIFHRGEHTLQEVKSCLVANGWRMRT